MKKIIPVLLLLSQLIQPLAFADGSSSRQITAQTIKNGSGILTLPTSTDTITGRATTDTLTNKSIDASTNTLTNISNSAVSSSAAIARSKIAAGTANNVLINDGSGNLSQESSLAVSRGGTGLTSGTSGGVPYYSSSSAITSSAALTSNQLVVGGGAGAAPAALGSLGTTTTVLHGNAGGAPSYGAAVLTTDVSGTLPVANGGTAVTSVTTSPTASSFAGWDANKNISANAFLPAYATTATAAGTTTLTVSSAPKEDFTGSTTQTVVLPVATTLSNGFSFLIKNTSSGVVTVQTSGSNTVKAMATNTQLSITCVNTAGGTGTASWSWTYEPVLDGAIPVTNGGTGLTTLTSGSVLVGAGTSNPSLVAPSTSGNILTSNGSTWISSAASAATNTTITYQRFTSGSGTYTAHTSPSPLYLIVTIIGSGGGGSGSGTAGGNDGAAGNNSTFGTSLLTAGGGSAGVWANNGGAGGTNTINSPAITVQNLAGSRGQGVSVTANGGGQYQMGGYGGPSALGIVCAGGTLNAAAPSPPANVGCGGGGGATNSTANNYSGGGGGGGGTLVARIDSPSATYSYAVGAAASGGSGGTNGFAGASSSAGLIVVEEHYQ